MTDRAEVLTFIGDSITDGERRTDPRGLGGGYVDAIADELAARGSSAIVLNRGISGDRVAHLRARWERDALTPAPDVLTVFVGVNDTLVAFFEGRATPFGAFEEGLDDILSRSAELVGRLIVVEPFYLEGAESADVHWREGSPFIREDLDRRRAIVRERAAAYGARLVVVQDPLTALAAERGTATIAPDGVHPSATGHRWLARAWLATYDATTG